MTGPIDAAYHAFAQGLARRLVSAGFINDPLGLQVDPESDIAPEDDGGEGSEVETAAGVFKGDTQPVRTLMGGPRRRYVVERSPRLELAAWGVNTDRWKAAMAAATAGIAAMIDDDPTLGGAAERLELTGLESDPFPPNGEQAVFTFTLRVRSGDPLGGTY